MGEKSSAAQMEAAQSSPVQWFLSAAQSWVCCNGLAPLSGGSAIVIGAIAVCGEVALVGSDIIRGAFGGSVAVAGAIVYFWRGRSTV